MHSSNFTCLLIFLLFTLSCSKNENVILSYSFASGQVYENSFITDSGILMNITENTSGKRVKTGSRIFARFDILEQISRKEYNIRLLNFNIPLQKIVVPLPNKKNDAEIGNDPILIKSCWFSGIYINMELMIASKTGSKTKHQINLIMDDLSNPSDTLYFSLRHNGYGESPALEDKPKSNGEISYNTFYASFILPPFIMFRLSYPISLSYTWYGKGKVSIKGYYRN